jgi:hypothetical protein
MNPLLRLKHHWIYYPTGLEPKAWATKRRKCIHKPVNACLKNGEKPAAQAGGERMSTGPAGSGFSLP